MEEIKEGFQPDEELNKESDSEVAEETQVSETDETEETGDDSVTLNKDEHSKLVKKVEEGDNYKKENELWRTGKKTLKEKREETTTIDVEKTVQTTLRKDRERQAAKEVRNEIPELQESNVWNSVVANLPQLTETDSVEDMKKKVLMTYNGWKSVQPKEGENLEVTAKLAHTEGTGGKTPTPPQKPKERLLVRSKGMKDWYPPKK